MMLSASPSVGSGWAGAVAGGAQVPVGVGSTGTPATGETVSTGDAQLDRITGINIDQIRMQRMGGAASGIPADPRTQGPNGAPGPNGPNGPQTTGTASRQGNGDKPKETPVYKKWWFWAGVAVSAYVVISIATTDSNSTTARARIYDKPAAPPPPSGLTLWSF